MDRANKTETVGTTAKLTIGSKAPKLTIAEWVQGGPIEDFQAGHIYVVEFWATWCSPCISGMPHLAELQERHKDNVTLVGITDEDQETVESFLARAHSEYEGKSWGEVASYTLARDFDGTTGEAYMDAAGRTTIPVAFIVDTDRRIVWIGHPGEIDEPLERVVAGTWNWKEHLAQVLKQERDEKALRATAAMIHEARNKGDLDRALELVNKAIEENDSSIDLGVLKFSLLQETNQYQDASAWAEKIGEDNWENNFLLYVLARSLRTQPAPPDRLEIALRFAKRITELKEEDPSAYSLIAEIYHEQENLEQAIVWQRLAVERCRKDENREEAEVVLNQYLSEVEGMTSPEGELEPSVGSSSESF